MIKQSRSGPEIGMSVDCKINAPITTDQFIGLLRAATLTDRRPVDDRACIEGMLNNSNLIVTARDSEKLVGMARSMTDFHFACYLSDLAVDEQYQKQGIGKRLQNLPQQQLRPKCKLILVTAPNANDYYQQIGYRHNPRCWWLERDQRIRSSQSRSVVPVIPISSLKSPALYFSSGSIGDSSD